MRRALLLTLAVLGAGAVPAAADVTITTKPASEGDGLAVTVDNTDLVAATVEVSDGTAKAGTDYEDVAQDAPALTKTSFTIATTEDASPELDETLVITAERFDAELDRAEGTIVDDDAPVLAIQDNTAGESAGAVSLAVARSPISRPTTISYTVTGGTATEPDLGSLSGTITVPPGGAFGVITIPVVNDTEDEADETFSVAIQSAGAAISRATATATITNDDLRTLTVSDARVVEGDGEPAAVARVLVSLDAPTFRTVTAQFATVGMTARAPQDFLSRLGQITLPPGQTQASIDVAITGDDAIEPSEQFAVLAGRQVGATVGDGTAVVTIADDDTAQGDDVPPNMRVSTPRRSGRTLTIRVSCPGNERRCVGRATFYAEADRRSRIRSLRRERRLGRKTFTLAGGKGRTLRLTVPRGVAQAARRAGRLKVRAYVVTEDLDDNVDTTSASATLRFRR